MYLITTLEKAKVRGTLERRILSMLGPSRKWADLPEDLYGYLTAGGVG